MVLHMQICLATENKHIRCFEWNLISKHVILAQTKSAIPTAIFWAIDVVKRQKRFHLSIIGFELFGSEKEISIVKLVSAKACEIYETSGSARWVLIAQELPSIKVKVPGGVQGSTVHVTRGRRKWYV